MLWHSPTRFPTSFFRKYLYNIAVRRCSLSLKMDLNLDLFKRELCLKAISVPPQRVRPLIERLKKENYLLQLPSIRPVVDSGISSRKLILLSDTFASEKDLPCEVLELIKEEDDGIVEVYQLQLGHEAMKTDEMLRIALPDEIPVIASFERAGHIAHVNLRSVHEPYKRIIGDIILLKNKGLRTVVNKTDSIATQFRTFPMEVIAGDADLVTEVNESNCRFKFDFENVYWNSRLSMEHKRVVESLESNAEVWDLFAGVGPFAIPAAKKGCTVLANDLNPHSYKWLTFNSELNKVERKIKCCNEDARDFAQKLMKTRDPISPVHIIMNLPASAYSFLGGFKKRWVDLPIVHCYGFASSEDAIGEYKALVEGILGCSIPNIQVREVRNVAPQKRMMCAEFKLPEAVCYDENEQDPDPRPSKRERGDELLVEAVKRNKS